MKAITLKHPWPWAICHRGKRIENRTWEPSPRQLPVGRFLAIHGGVRPRPGAPFREFADDLASIDRVFPRTVPAEACILPGIVAVCRFGGVVTASRDLWFGGPYGWLLTDLVVLAEPVPCQGARKLWDLPPEVLALVRERWAEALALAAKEAVAP